LQLPLSSMPICDRSEAMLQVKMWLDRPLRKRAPNAKKAYRNSKTCTANLSSGGRFASLLPSLPLAAALLAKAHLLGEI
jgi:hypothetical protein